MSDETRVSGEDVEDENVDYVDAINKLKENTVSKEQYSKLREENKRLLDALINGEQIEVKDEAPVNVEELRKTLFNGDKQLNNLEYVKTALDLRDALIEKGERDPFLPIGTHITVTAEMIEKAQNVADVLRECVDFADGDSGIFTAQLQRNLKDPLTRRGR